MKGPRKRTEEDDVRFAPSYCAITVSDRSREQVLAYIEGQKEKEKKKF